MKIKLQLVKALFFLSIGATAQITIPNAGFESWSSASGTNTLMPTGWKSISSFPGIHRTTNAHAGSYALKIGVAQYFTAAGGSDMTYNFSFPQVNALPAAYTFWAKAHINGSDKLHVTANLMKSPGSTLYGNVNYNFDALTSLNNNTTVWTQYTFTLQTIPSPVDSAYLRFQFYPAADTGSYVLIDDLAFTGTAQGIRDLNNASIIEGVYPNPASALQHLIYSISETASVSLNVYDLLGNLVMPVFTESQAKNKYKADMDVSGLGNGIYDVRLIVNGKSYSQKIVVCH